MKSTVRTLAEEKKRKTHGIMNMNTDNQNSCFNCHQYYDTQKNEEEPTTSTRTQHLENVTHCTKRNVPMDLQTRPKC